jgi:hypothetical protein
MLFAQPLRLASRHRELLDSSEFPKRMCGRRWRLTNLDDESLIKMSVGSDK